MSSLEIRQIPDLAADVVYLARRPETEAHGGRERRMVCHAHHHGDHTGGTLDIRRATGCTIVGL